MRHIGIKSDVSQKIKSRDLIELPETCKFLIELLLVSTSFNLRLKPSVKCVTNICEDRRFVHQLTCLLGVTEMFLTPRCRWYACSVSWWRWEQSLWSLGTTCGTAERFLRRPGRRPHWPDGRDDQEIFIGSESCHHMFVTLRQVSKITSSAVHAVDDSSHFL